MKVFERVQGIVAKELAVENTKVVDSALLAEDLDADSLNKFSILSKLEEEFGIELDTDEGMGVETVGDLVKLVNRAVSS